MSQVFAVLCLMVALVQNVAFHHTSIPFHNRLQLKTLNIDHIFRMNSTPIRSTIGTGDEINAIKPKQSITSVMSQATNLFPVWVLLASISGKLKPEVFQWFTPFITPALATTMMSMGMSLSPSDFSGVLKCPQYVLVGFLAQYMIMPTSAFYISKFLKLGPELTAGLILVGCAPGGTASNLVTMIAGADLPLSVLMTAASTLAAVVMTPLLTSKLVGSSIVVNAWDLVMSSLNVVLLPVFFGLLLNTKYPKTCQQVGKYTPFISVLLVSMICGTVSAANSAAGLGTFSLRLLLSICLLHSSGFLWGYVLAKVTRAGERRARTISIETGMQNSALACVLAQHFPNPHLCALPGSISATCHSVIGSLLAAYWRKRPPKD